MGILVSLDFYTFYVNMYMYWIDRDMTEFTAGMYATETESFIFLASLK